MRNVDLAAVIGKQARIAREALGLTQAEVARDVGFVAEVYGRVERGGMVPSVPALVRMAARLRVTPDVLLGLGRRRRVASPGRRRELQALVQLLAREDEYTVEAVLEIARVMLATRERNLRRR